MADGLKIYACSGVGANRVSGKTPGAAVYDMEGTSTLTNTQAMNSLLALMNVTKAELSIADGVEKRDLLSQLDVYSVCFYYAQLYRNDTATLREVGNILAEEVAGGVFDALESDSIEAHAARVDAIIANTDAMLQDGKVHSTSNSDFMSWYQKNVLNLNKQGLTAKEISGIGATSDFGEITEYLSQAGTYFLYLYLTPEQLNNSPEIVKVRRKKQEELYVYVRKCFVSLYGDEAALQNILRASIINQYGTTPDKVVAKLYDITPGDVKKIGKEKQVGVIATLTAEAIMWIIIAAIAAAAAILLGIINACATVAAAKYQAPENVDLAVQDETDISDWAKYNSTKKSSSTNWLLLAGVAAGAWWLLGKKKKSSNTKSKE